MEVWIDKIENVWRHHNTEVQGIAMQIAFQLEPRQSLSITAEEIQIFIVARNRKQNGSVYCNNLKTSDMINMQRCKES